MKRLILHIPHSSINIPFKNGYVVDDDILLNEILKLTDWYTDELFCSKEDLMVVTKFSRIFCDVERFSDDSKEIMSQYGMGVLYEKSDAGKIIRKVSQELRNNILEHYYLKHHEKLNEFVTNQLSQGAKVLIIDCHSFPNTPFNRDLIQKQPRPDFNIGIDEFHTPIELIKNTYDFFKLKGYNVKINKPYKGTIVPINYYQINPNVNSIMIEVNRRLYLKEGTNEKLDNFDNIKKLIKEYLNFIKLNYK